MFWSIVIAVCIAVFGFIPLMGIPGAIVLSVSELLAKPFNIELLCTKGDSAWPAAILATWIWPVFIPVSFYLCFNKLTLPNIAMKCVLFALLLTMFGCIVTAGIETLARSEAKSSASGARLHS